MNWVSRHDERSWEQLTEIGEDEVKQLHGVGPKAMNQLRRALGTLGLSFADKKRKKG